MKNLIYIIIFITIAATSIKSHAGYNANMRGKVTQVLTYTYSTLIYFRLENQPSSHPTCKATFFAIDAATPDNIRQQVLSRLLTAYASGEVINIGYDKTAGCSHSYIKVYRVG